MAFNSVLFLFVFAPVLFLVDRLLRGRGSNMWLLVTSILFYAWGEPTFVFVVLASSLIDFVLVGAMHRSAAPGRRKALMIAAVVANVALLVYCKYLNFFADAVHTLLPSIPVPHVEMLLPLAISFLVFEKITYIVDVYRNVSLPARRLRDYLLFVFVFPKLLAGPILKFHEVIGQLTVRRPSLDEFGHGLTRFLMGLGKKVLIADSVAGIADQLFAADPAHAGFGIAWLGAIAFAVQIYFDFSGYSDMAIGLARMLGIRLPENFRQPYLATGFGDFWRRWHISLSSWIREYLYISLGGNRVSPVRMYVNLWLCFLASGLWHGANYTFIAWGAFHGIWVCADHMGMKKLWPRIPRVLGVLVTFALVTIGWVLFRAPTLDHAMTLIGTMMQPWKASQIQLDVALLPLVTLVVGLVLCFIPLDRVTAWWGALPARAARWAALLPAAGLVLVAAWTYGRVFTSTFTPFIYFKF
jgi:alginate O-acetyltransferase complex protein AlgI